MDTSFKADSGLASSNRRNVRFRRPRVGDAGISLRLRTNLFLGTNEMGERILSYLARAGDIFVPEIFDGGKLTGGRKVKFDPNDLTLPLKGWVDDRYSLGIIAERHHPVEVSLHVSATDFLMFDHFTLSVGSKWFLSNGNLERFVTVAKDLYHITQANSGFIQNWREEQVLGTETDQDGHILGYKPVGVQWSLQGLFWANFFGTEYVEMFGREKLLSAPWHKAEKLSDGGLLVFISESPFDAAKPEYQALKKQLCSDLGMDAFCRDSPTQVPDRRTEEKKCQTSNAVRRSPRRCFSLNHTDLISLI